MTTVEAADARRLGGALTTVLGALWSARSWRATIHAVVGLPLGVAAFAVTVFLPVFAWYSAGYGLSFSISHREADHGDWALTAVLVVFAAALPVPLLRWVRAFSALQRMRFRALLGVEIPPPPGVEGSWLSRLVRAWRALSTWRQLSYHLLGLVIGTVGSALVAVFWSAGILAAAYLGDLWTHRRLGIGLAVATLASVTLLAAPWVARGVARVDAALALTLLGPSRSEELARRVESLARSRADIVAATDAERRRIERDLHDGAQQRLVSLAMNLGMARATLDDAPGPARQAIEQAHDEATQALAELREFVRGLHPAVLNDRGLDAALSGIVARAPLPVRLHVDVAQRCSPSIEAVAYFVVSEALANVAKHAQANHAEVTVERAGDRLHIAVTDDGRGGANLDTAGAAGSGLRGLAQRAAVVDGTLTVLSPPGGPTTITVELPCES